MKYRAVVLRGYSKLLFWRICVNKLILASGMAMIQSTNPNAMNTGISVATPSIMKAIAQNCAAVFIFPYWFAARLLQ